MSKRSSEYDRTIAASPGSGTVKVTILRKRIPRLPHERDESADSQGKAPEKRMLQASADLARGLVDTDLGRETGRLRPQHKVR